MNRTLIRISGMAAIAGGALRIVGSFAPGSQEVLYFATDAFLLFGLMGWYLARADRLGIAGAVGFAVAAIAILIVRSASLFGAQGYAIGAGALLLGLIVMDASTLLRRNGPLVAPLLWLVALVLGAASFAAAAGVAFGLGFAAAGIVLLRDQTQSAQTSISTVT